MKEKDAEEYTQSLGQIVGGAWRQIHWAQRNGVPRALGLSVDEWVTTRLGGYVKMNIADRRAAAKELTDEGESTREIADVLGVSHVTVQGDLKAGKDLPDNESDAKKNNSLDGDTGKNFPEGAPLDAMAGLVATGELVADADKKELHTEAAEKNEAISAIEAVPVAGLYSTIVIDPPWPMQKIERKVRPNQVAFDYPVMSLEEIKAIELPAAPDCHVFQWTTQKFLPAAFECFESWGVRYVCTFVWHKPGGFQPIGLPQYNGEFALYGRIGTPEFIDTKGFPTVFDAPRGKHSEKPEDFYAVIRRVTGDGRVDMFSRRNIEGFTGWGNEASE